MWIVSYIGIFVERFIVVYAFYPKKKNRAHARLWNIKKVKCQGIRLPVSHHFPLFWILVEEIHHRTQCKTKVVQLQVYNKIWMLSHLSSSKYLSGFWICNISLIFHSGGMCDEKTVEYLRDLIAERQVIEEHVTGNRNKPHLQSESDCIKTTTDNNPSTSSHPTTSSSGCTKSIAQRLLDQG